MSLPYTPREPAFHIVCRCGAEFVRPAWRVRQAARQGATLHCSYDCAHAARRTRTPESLAEYHRSYRARNRERIRQNQKAERHGEKRAHVLARDRAIYRRNVDVNRQRARDYAASHPEAAKRRRIAWPAQNPERAYFHMVRNNIAHSVGMRSRDVPDHIVEARIEYLKLRRSIFVASVDGRRMAETTSGSGRSPTSAVPQGDAQ